jgi:hypothetical protein
MGRRQEYTDMSAINSGLIVLVLSKNNQSIEETRKYYHQLVEPLSVEGPTPPQ